MDRGDSKDDENRMNKENDNRKDDKEDEIKKLKKELIVKNTDVNDLKDKQESMTQKAEDEYSRRKYVEAEMKRAQETIETPMKV